ncbi:MAG: pilus assembly protein PilM [Paraglaciecola sp.]|uniref:type IV pilus assembly protein PilM n=1 Tax=Paraglaciecola sp. TaxID=1920173 RepID=UPI00273F1B30|nr:type IV pilus assembly protein PilM [Paraglaciecola sp.]MDP5030612.1 pilus assembly protein PilM [Paraglaciecola sp.]MDP5129689.1 pilus assembly protein PilM [Paraglaciecola sp.]
MTNLFRKKAQQMIGLDIGSRFVKAVLLEKTNGKFSLQAFACEPIIGNAFAEREIKDFEAVSHALKKVKASLKTKNKHVAIAVSGSTVLNKIVYMDPGLSDYELESQIELEADSLIPYPLEEVYIDFEEVADSTTTANKVEVLLSAVHKDIVDRRITLLGEVGYEAKIVDVESYSLGSAVANFYASDDKDGICCLNIGATYLQLCWVKDGKVHYTKDHSFGMDALVQDLVLLYNQERSHIEKQLQTNSLPDNWKLDSYPVFLANLQQNINRALQVFVSATGAKRPTKLLICGGACHVATVTEDLANELAIDIEMFNPFADMTISDTLQNSELSTFAPQLAIAAGLACRSFSPWHI